jgi:hypothetical protein
MKCARPTSPPSYLTIVMVSHRLHAHPLGSGPIPFRERDWRKYNKLIQDLIAKCLETDPIKRIQTFEAL